MSSTAITVFLGKQVGTMLAKKFGASIVERWTRHRAEAFFVGFLQALAREFREGTELREVDRKLDEILGDEERSEVLFDAYRTVCFSKSKTLGPRIVGLLAGSLVVEGRMSNNDEDQVFLAAEEMSDSDLVEFFKSYRTYLLNAKTPNERKEPYLEGCSLIIPWCEDHRDSAWPHSREKEVEMSPVDMHEAFGPWATVLESIGVLSSRMIHRKLEYEADSERHIDEGGVVDFYSHSIVFRPSAKLLSELVERALGASSDGKL